jgi:SPX domain protein involved in polyphosphate accumulation
LDRIAGELIQLERYQKLNILGFSKLLKKHDKHSGVEAKEWFMLRVEDQPFAKRDLDNVLLQLSQTWKALNLFRTKQIVLQRDKQEGPSAQNFERKTTKVVLLCFSLTCYSTGFQLTEFLK